MAASDVTAIFSNMSVVKMPEAYVPYIERFGVYTSTPKTELCMCSFEDKLSLGFTSRYDSMNIKRNFFQILLELGIHSKVEEPDYPEERLASAAAVKFFVVVLICLYCFCGDCGSGTDIFCDCGITYFFNRKYIDADCGIIRPSGRNLCRGNCS